ncbi:ATPase family AAA domain-containing protein 2B isoform X6 [Pipistrellus kuhlii]|uniref:ATPase family AAA domain-containing protein 2B isoform X6 n=1 Tax=Pipistrellus kuhlii TaxID=59472 RepID=UPI00174F5680|nr:ATPase family AAA domain-containing protein 2B isoform X6 [Pipistrellus kuhlii]
MVNTRKSSLRLLGSKSPGPGPGAGAEAGATGGSSHFISSRTRSSKTRAASCPAAKAGGGGGAGGAADEARKSEVDGSLSDSHVSPPAKRTLKQPDSVCKDKSKSRSTGQREEWNITGQARLTSQPGATLSNGHSSLSLRSHPLRGEKKGDGDLSCMNGDMEVRKSCRSRKNRFESVNQSLLFDQLVNSTAEAVLQEMDNINIRRNRRSGEVERLRMWTDTEFENMDMYSRVKRRRKSLRRNSYGIQNHHEVSTEGEEEESQEEDGDIEVEEAEGEENDRPYNLRQRKTVDRYQAPPIVPAHQKKRENTLFDIHRSPARRSHIRRKKHAIHSSDTTSSDEERFERRKSKSMARARNRCLPMNLRTEDLASGILRERVKVGASLADVDPMNIDKSVRFDSIGGLSHHIHALKEMVVFPLLYPEIFEKFKIQPPRGCLFYGPPGTGKTLVARALANECSQGDKKVAFFMRKGADCLSKWVGESERQLRLLFDQAYLMRPSIIFFDEIDGLAPVRSSRQDQIHSSIVSTLLALMDGLDNRGEIVVIGATNRLDSIDPALRRPGRFDREFLFNLPDQKARKHILQIHTRDWNPKLSDAFLGELAEKCVGYCGADIKALCTEAALIALRRRYPQIYASSHKLQLDVSSIVLSAQDFYHAMQNIVPASQRAVMSSGHALSPIIRPLLERSFNNILAVLQKVFPHAEISQSDKKEDIDTLVLDDSEDENALSIFETSCHSGSPKKQSSAAAVHKSYLHFTMSPYHQPTSYRPRLLLSGERGSGQTSHLAPALLHTLEKFSVHRLDLPALYSVSAKTPEESCAQIFREARRTVPSIVYMPHIGDWWEAVSETVRATFLTLLQDIPSFSPIFLLSTSETMYSELPEEVSDYLEVIKEPMDLSTIITKIDKHNYLTSKDFLKDIDLICSNALEYNPDKDPGDKIIRHRACTLKDTAHAIIAAELDPEFNKLCEEIKEARIKRGLSVTAEQINPHGTGTRKTETRVEEAFRHKQRNPMDAWHNSANKFRVRRKSRRRSQWGKGIIKKRKVNNLKKDDEDTKFADYENHTGGRKLLENGEFELSTDCHEENGEEAGDLSMTNDESSCDVMDMDQGQRLNSGAGTKENFASTEEESSNESLLVHSSSSVNPGQTSGKEPFLKGNCLNGEASTDSFEGVPALECQNGKAEVVPLCSNGDKCSPEQKILLEDQSKEKPEASNEDHGDDPEKLEALECSNNEKLEPGPDVEVKDPELDKEGASKVKKYRKLILEQAKATTLELVPEEPSEPVPPLIVDHERLKKLLDLLVDKSNNLAVDQLERLYSLLSQCIYRHRKDYDKSQLIEEMERTVHTFETFL